ncbi:MAG: hypothetical protein AAF497_18845, partial [Planctomycetota bacterium]
MKNKYLSYLLIAIFVALSVFAFLMMMPTLDQKAARMISDAKGSFELKQGGPELLRILFAKDVDGWLIGPFD